MQQQKNSGFTLIELSIVISIILLVLSFVYMPYAFYQKKLAVKQVAREVSQALSEARNMAINGYEGEVYGVVDDLENKSIGLYLTSETGENIKMTFFAYPHDFDPIPPLSFTKAEINVTQDITIIKERSLAKGTEFDGATIRKRDSSNSEFESFEDNILFFFHPITGSGNYFSFTSGSKINHEASTPFSLERIDLDFSYKGSTSDILMKQVRYDTRVNIIDYD